MHDVAEMDAAAMLAAARADHSPAAEVARLRDDNTPPAQRRRFPFGAALMLVACYTGAAFAIAAPFGRMTWAVVAQLCVLGLVAMGATVFIIAAFTPVPRPSERILLVQWFLRRMAAQGDDVLLPLLPESNTPEVTEVARDRSVRARRLDDVTWVRRIRALLHWCLPIYILLLLIAIAEFNLPAPSAFRDRIEIPPVIYVVYPITGLAISGMVILSSFLSTQRWNHRETISAQDDGLHIRTRWSRREQVIGWSRVWSLTRVAFHTDATTDERYMYILDAGDAVFSWGYYPTLLATAFVGLATTPPRGEVLAREMMTSTGLPLRDGTALLHATATLMYPRFKPDWLKLLGNYRGIRAVELPPQFALALDAAKRPQMTTGHWRWLALGLLGVSVVVYMAFCVVGWIAWGG